MLTAIVTGLLKEILRGLHLQTETVRGFGSEKLKVK